MAADTPTNVPAEAPWDGELPSRWRAQVVAPCRFTVHVDDWAHARKVVGWDAEGRRCYVRHLHTEVEQRFDIDEFPLDVPVWRERRIAWRLAGGDWLLQVDRAERIDSCRPRLRRGEPVLVRERDLGL